MRITIKRIITLCIISCLLTSDMYVLTGCVGHRSSKVPMLDDPVATTHAFRPVTRRYIGDVETLMGIVVPAQYKCRTEQPVILAHLDVSIGDYVKEGQVIAKADTSELEAQLKTLTDSVEEMTEQKKCISEVFEKQIEQLGYQKKQYKENGDKDSAKSVDNDIAIEKENFRYDKAVIENNIAAAQKNIAAIKDEMAKLTFTARHDGFVSYIAPVYDGEMLSANETVAVISDEKELYIETPDMLVGDYSYDKYKSKWILIDGKEKALKEFQFSQDELSIMKDKGEYPCMRFVVDGSLTPGMTVPLYFVRDEYRECLAVGNDSIYRDGDMTFVYVRGENDERVQRKVTLGETDNFYSEVTDGLVEGEDVFYENNTLVPTSFSKVNAERSDYFKELSSEYYEEADADFDIYIAKCNGVIDRESVVGEGEKVYAGDRLAGISTVTGRAEAYEAKIAIDNLDMTHKQAEKNYKRQKKLKEKEFKEEEDLKENKTDDKDHEARSHKYDEEILKCDISMMEIQHKYENKEYKRQREALVERYNEISGGGKENDLTYITAADDGIMGRVFYDVTGAVTKGSMVAVTSKKSDEIILVKMKSSVGNADKGERTVAGVGQTVKIADGQKTYSGVCVGVKNGGSSGQFFVRLDGVKLSDFGGDRDNAKISDFEGDRDNAKISDFGGGSDNTDENDEQSEGGESNKKHITISFYGTYMKSVITVPKKAVYTETDSLTQKKNSYVWKLINDVPVKEYVKVCEAVSDGDKAVIISGVDAGDVVIYE